MQTIKIEVSDGTASAEWWTPELVTVEVFISVRYNMATLGLSDRELRYYFNCIMYSTTPEFQIS
jgi:hypothetical protein